MSPWSPRVHIYDRNRCNRYLCVQYRYTNTPGGANVPLPSTDLPPSVYLAYIPVIHWSFDSRSGCQPIQVFLFFFFLMLLIKGASILPTFVSQNVCLSLLMSPYEYLYNSHCFSQYLRLKILQASRWQQSY